MHYSTLPGTASSWDQIYPMGLGRASHTGHLCTCLLHMLSGKHLDCRQGLSGPSQLLNRHRLSNCWLAKHRCQELPATLLSQIERLPLPQQPSWLRA